MLPASGLIVCSSLLWLPQAGILAFSVGRIASGAHMMEVAPFAAAFLLTGIIKALLEKAGNRRAFMVARGVLSAKRREAVDATAAGSPLDTERPASGEAAAAISEQAEAITAYVARFKPARLKATIVPVVLFMAIVPFSWVAAFVLLLTMPVIPMFMALIGWHAKAASERQLSENGSMNAFLLDRLRGLETIRTLGAVDMTAERLRMDAESLKKRTMSVLRIAFLSSAVLELFAALGVAMTAVYIGFHLLGFLDFGAWGQTLTLSQGLFVLLLAPAFFEPLRELSAVWHDRASGEAAASALERLTARQAGYVGDGKPNNPSPAPASTSLDIRNVSFSYPNRRAVLRDFSLKVEAGEKIALLGSSGAGKSTILSLVAGLANASDGEILIEGVPLTAETADSLRRLIGWVGQSTHFFSGSLTANIKLGREEIDARRVTGALHLAGLAGLAERRGTFGVGEGGSRMSGGEAVRLAIARAAASPSARLFLVDEPTAHLDGETARSITESLLALSQGKTMIVATHDPQLAARMDRTVVLDEPGQLQTICPGTVYARTRAGNAS